MKTPDYRALPRRFRRKRLLIVGCGDIGCRIAAQLQDRWQVFGIVRSRAGRGAVRAAGAVPLPAAAGRRRLEALADGIVHSAPPPADARLPDGGLPFDPVTRDWVTRLLGAHGQRSSRRRLVSARRGLGSSRCALGSSRCALGLWPAGPSATLAAKRLVYLSTTGVYGDRQGALVDETDAVDPHTDRARRRVDAERQLRIAGRGARRPARIGRQAPPTRLAAVVLRVPGIYAFDRLPLERLRQGLPALTRDDDVHTNHVHADDLARLAVVALLRGRSQRVINVVDDSDLLMGDYLDQVAAWARLPPPPRVDRPTLLAQVSAIRASFMSESRRIGNARMKRELRARLAWSSVADFLAAHEAPG